MLIIHTYKMHIARTLRNAYDNILVKRDKEQNNSKFYYDKFHKNVKFDEGDQVLVYIPVPKQGLTQKLLPRWEGPYTIEKKLGVLTFLVTVQDRSIVVHVQRLRKYKILNQ